MTIADLGYYVLWLYCSQDCNLFGFPICRSWAYLMKVIPETYLMKVITETFLMKVIPERAWWRLFQNVPDEGYYRTCLMKVITERAWWRLLQKRAWWRLLQKRAWWRLFQNVPDEGYYRNVPDEGYSRNASCALNLISTFLLPSKNAMSPIGFDYWTSRIVSHLSTNRAKGDPRQLAEIAMNLLRFI